MYIGNVHDWLILHGPASFLGRGNGLGILGMLVLCFLKSQTYTLCYCPSLFHTHTHTHPCTNTFQKRTLRHGTTTACYFATIHLEATKELCQVISMPSHYNNISLGNTLPLSRSATNNRARVASFSGFTGILQIGNEITYPPSPTHPPLPHT